MSNDEQQIPLVDHSILPVMNQTSRHGDIDDFITQLTTFPLGTPIHLETSIHLMEEEDDESDIPELVSLDEEDYDESDIPELISSDEEDDDDIHHIIRDMRQLLQHSYIRLATFSVPVIPDINYDLSGIHVLDETIPDINYDLSDIHVLEADIHVLEETSDEDEEDFSSDEEGEPPHGSGLSITRRNVSRRQQ